MAILLDTGHRRIADGYWRGAAVTEFPTKYFCIELPMRREWGGEWGGGIPLSSRLGVWENVVSSPSGVRGGVMAANTFWYI